MLLFRDPTVDGLKTGHTDAAGYCLIATAKRDFPNLGGRRLLAIVLGATSETARANEAQKLLNWGYTAFDGDQTVRRQPACRDARGLEGQRKDRQAGPHAGGRRGRSGRHSRTRSRPRWRARTRWWRP